MADLVVELLADPVELGCIILNPLSIKERCHRDPTTEDSEFGTVTGRDIVEVVRRNETPGSRHVFRHNRWIAGQMTAHMLCEKPRIAVIPASGAISDNQIDRLAAVKFLHGFSFGDTGKDR